MHVIIVTYLLYCSSNANDVGINRFLWQWRVQRCLYHLYQEDPSLVPRYKYKANQPCILILYRFFFIVHPMPTTWISINSSRSGDSNDVYIIHIRSVLPCSAILTAKLINMHVIIIVYLLYYSPNANNMGINRFLLQWRVQQCLYHLNPEDPSLVPGYKYKANQLCTLSHEMLLVTHDGKPIKNYIHYLNKISAYAGVTHLPTPTSMRRAVAHSCATTMEAGKAEVVSKHIGHLPSTSQKHYRLLRSIERSVEAYQIIATVTGNCMQINLNSQIYPLILNLNLQGATKGSSQLGRKQHQQREERGSEYLQEIQMPSRSIFLIKLHHQRNVEGFWKATQFRERLPNTFRIKLGLLKNNFTFFTTATLLLLPNIRSLNKSFYFLHYCNFTNST